MVPALVLLAITSCGLAFFLILVLINPPDGFCTAAHRRRRLEIHLARRQQEIAHLEERIVELKELEKVEAKAKPGAVS